MSEQSSPRGSTSALFALLATVFLATTALAVDVGYWYVVKNEIQNAADSAAFSGAGKLFTATTGPNWSDAKSQAVSAINYNKVDHKIASYPADRPPATGYWHFAGRLSESSGQLLSAPLAPEDAPAVQVWLTTKVNTWFSKVLGIKEIGVSAKAVAGVTAPSYVGPSAMFPFVMSKCVYDHYWTNTTEYRGPVLNPATGQAYIFRIGPDYPIAPCASSGVWTTYLEDLSSTDAVKKLVADGNPTTLSIGDLIWIQPGIKNTLYQTIDACSLNGSSKCANATVAVVNNVMQKTRMPILAFACLRILNANNGNKPYVEIQMASQCRPQESGGTGPFYGALSPPKLFN